jgi:hypothetical protein
MQDEARALFGLSSLSFSLVSGLLAPLLILGFATGLIGRERGTGQRGGSRRRVVCDGGGKPDSLGCSWVFGEGVEEVGRVLRTGSVVPPFIADEGSTVTEPRG